MADLIALLAMLAGIIFWVWRRRYAATGIKDVHQDTNAPRRRARDAADAVLGTRLRRRIEDPAFAATVLMLQLLRGGSHVTAAEKKRVIGFMEEPLRIADVEATYANAWALTDPTRALGPVADDLVPVLRRTLERREQLDLVDMLKAVANAYGEASAAQSEAIDQFRRRLMAEDKHDLT